MWAVVLAVLLIGASVFAWLRTWRSKDKHDNSCDLQQKFAAKDGITFFDNDNSPCARRVRTVLYEKGIKHRVINVNLFTRENRHPSYLAINPLGKVPAMVVRNVKGIPDCCLFESNAITEWLDEQFPDTIQLYPSDPWERAQVKMWQRWETAMAEDFWPMMYANVMGFVLRFAHSRSDYEKSLDKSDSYQFSKMMKTYDDKLLSTSEKVDLAMRLFGWLDLLEKALVGKNYLCGNSFTVADISVLPRLALFPLIGFLTTEEERHRYPNLIRYMNSLKSRESIVACDRSPTTVKLLKLIPHSVIDFVGNWRIGKKCLRVYGRDFLKEIEATTPCDLPMPSNPANDNDIILYHHIAWPSSIMIHIASLELGIKTEVKAVNMMHLEQRSSSFLALNPSGEIPTICHKGRVIYDSMNVVEYLNTVFSEHSDKSLLPEDPTDRIRVRMWQAWVSTTFNYQFLHLYKQYIVAAVLKTQFSSVESLLQELHKSTTASEYTNDLVTVFKHDPASEEIKSKMTPYKLGVEKALEYLEQELSGHEYLVGSKLSAADISVFSLLMLFKWVGISVSASKYPSIAVWMEKLYSMPSFSLVVKEFEGYMLSHEFQ